MGALFLCLAGLQYYRQVVLRYFLVITEHTLLNVHNQRSK